MNNGPYFYRASFANSDDSEWYTIVVRSHSYEGARKEAIAYAERVGIRYKTVERIRKADGTPQHLLRRTPA